MSSACARGIRRSPLRLGLGAAVVTRRLPRRLALGAAILIHAVPATRVEAQQATLVSGTERHITSDPEGRPMVEPHLAVHPDDPDHLLVGVIVISSDMSESDCASLVSLDGGEGWIRHDSGLASCGDPWGIVLADGRARP